jgi:ferrochelatase
VFDAILLVSFGGPEGPAEVIPFLERVLTGRNVPPERLQEVAHHYDLFGGVSPINGQNRALRAALEAALAERGPQLPVYWGNRNWHPLLADTALQMGRDGVKRALAFVTSAYGSYSGCRQYREDIGRAQDSVGPTGPHIEKLRLFFDHPGFVEANVDAVKDAFARVPNERREDAALAFTAHSIPSSMACAAPYQEQLRETCRLVAEGVGRTDWQLVFQSRSGPPTQPWLAPDVLDHLRGLAANHVRDVVVSPVGFVSDHMEVLYDLDTEAVAVARELGLSLQRAATAATHPSFVPMIRELILERTEGAPRRALGRLGAAADACAPDCCPPPPRPPGRGNAHSRSWDK